MRAPRGIAALLRRGHNAGMTVWRNGWQRIAARPLRWILLLALAARLAGLALFPHYFDLGREQGIITHDIYARNLLETGVYGLQRGVADAELPPLYSVFLALLYSTVGRGFWQLGAAQCLARDRVHCSALRYRASALAAGHARLTAAKCRHARRRAGGPLLRRIPLPDFSEPDNDRHHALHRRHTCLALGGRALERGAW